ncbi:glycosyltransferase family 4 protein [Prevotella sp. OH937_COT-195]|uniref:glycosyltransferase family 4 protein n=1 Tax=Prevotella sp. OH937_COT-195 TaxID=2491051 RepID=UPI000F64F757|nr:glycosyltransferase family 1 protein [Prevotella sp. OH937_COT-195]RRC99482.1 glycosyltransferase family 1 protein [Prevotella sp. OH937_COT-195]
MKRIAVDLRFLDCYTGFGDICRNYARRLSAINVPDMHFIFMLSDNHFGEFGQSVTYISCDHPEEDIRNKGLKIDLWHSTDQMYEYYYESPETVHLLTIHDLNFLYEKKHFHRWKHIWRFRKRVKNADYISFISHFAKNDVDRIYGLKDKPYCVIYNGITPVGDKEGVKPAFVGDNNEKFFFAISQIRRKKNFHTLVPMMLNFPDHKLYICGDNDFKYAEEIRKSIAKLGLDRVKLTGRVSEDEKTWLYKHCEAFLFPSKAEGFGIPAIEAMQQGCKVFSSRLTSLPEICGKHAVYWDNFEAEHMARVVKDGLAVDDSDMVQERKDYAHSFNYDKYTTEYLQLYKKILCQK